MAPPPAAAAADAALPARFHFAHRPELIVFAVDRDAEMAAEAVAGWSRFDAVAHAISALAAAKQRADPAHRFALAALARGTTLAPCGGGGLFGTAEQLVEGLRGLAPGAERFEVFDFDSVAAAVEPLKVCEGREEPAGGRGCLRRDTCVLIDGGCQQSLATARSFCTATFTEGRTTAPK